MMYPIRIIKLVSGEVIIAGIAGSSESSEVYNLERPMAVSLVPTVGKDNRAETAVFMKNWIDFSQDEMYIVPKSMVICISNPDKEILGDYNDAKVKFDLLEAEQDLRDAQDDFGEDEGEEIDGDDEDDLDAP